MAPASAWFGTAEAMSRINRQLAGEERHHFLIHRQQTQLQGEEACPRTTTSPPEQPQRAARGQGPGANGCLVYTRILIPFTFTADRAGTSRSEALSQRSTTMGAPFARFLRRPRGPAGVIFMSAPPGLGLIARFLCQCTNIIRWSWDLNPLLITASVAKLRATNDIVHLTLRGPCPQTSKEPRKCRRKGKVCQVEDDSAHLGQPERPSEVVA